VTDRVLIVGYGNTLRSDDGLGWHAAERLADDPRFADVEVVQRHQLTPELALDISDAAVVVLIDASSELPPGELTVKRVERASGASNHWSHHLSPATLVSLSHELYGRASDVYIVSCGVQSVEMGDRLTPEVEAVLPKVIDAVAGLVASHN
jgi:hydrogenase maturation protease